MGTGLRQTSRLRGSDEGTIWHLEGTAECAKQLKIKDVDLVCEGERADFFANLDRLRIQHTIRHVRHASNRYQTYLFCIATHWALLFFNSLTFCSCSAFVLLVTISFSAGRGCEFYYILTKLETLCDVCTPHHTLEHRLRSYRMANLAFPGHYKHACLKPR